MQREDQVSEQARHLALLAAEQQLLRSGDYPSVTAVALGQQSLSVFVTDAPPGAPDPRARPIPTTITVVDDAGQPATVPLSLIVIGCPPELSTSNPDLPSDLLSARLIAKVVLRDLELEQPARMGLLDSVGFVAPPATMQIGAGLSARSPEDKDGVCSWIGPGIAITAAHVVGFDSIGKEVYSGGVRIGTVDKIAYASAQIDAARIQLDAATQPLCSIVAQGAEPRYVSDDDVFSGANWAVVYLPHLSGIYTVKIYHVHGTGDFQMRSPLDGFSFNPRPLILTDYCTVAGDSGAILLGSDRRPIGFLSGRVYITSTSTYLSAFTELMPAVQELL